MLGNIGRSKENSIFQSFLHLFRGLPYVLKHTCLSIHTDPAVDITSGRRIWVRDPLAAATPEILKIDAFDEERLFGPMKRTSFTYTIPLFLESRTGVIFAFEVFNPDFCPQEFFSINITHAFLVFKEVKTLLIFVPGLEDHRLLAGDSDETTELISQAWDEWAKKLVQFDAMMNELGMVRVTWEKFSMDFYILRDESGIEVEPEGSGAVFDAMRAECNARKEYIDRLLFGRAPRNVAS
ncbi:hypothetical protein TWF718_002455 [Orbilia javanica]|uniref:Uncharacterized protein n=1 Tax=Orbilia javanica TaxID=47235 RepID=A0AAN8NM96_9PEZI